MLHLFLILCSKFNISNHSEFCFSMKENSIRVYLVFLQISLRSSFSAKYICLYAEDIRIILLILYLIIFELCTDVPDRWGIWRKRDMPGRGPWSSAARRRQWFLQRLPSAIIGRAWNQAISIHHFFQIPNQTLTFQNINKKWRYYYFRWIIQLPTISWLFQWRSDHQAACSSSLLRCRARSDSGKARPQRVRSASTDRYMWWIPEKNILFEKFNSFQYFSLPWHLLWQNQVKSRYFGNRSG